MFFRWMDAVLHFLLVWYYCTLTIRENILRINGSRFVFINCWTLSMIWEFFSFIFTRCNIYYHDTNILSLDFIMKLKWLHCRHLTTVIDFSSGPVAHGQWKLIWTSDLPNCFYRIYKYSNFEVFWPVNSKVNFEDCTKALNILSLIHFAWNGLHITFQILGFAFDAILLWQQEYIYTCL